MSSITESNGMQDTVFDDSRREHVHRKLRSGVGSAGTVKRVLEAPLSARVGHDLYEVGDALAGLDGLKQHINQVHKTLAPSKGGEGRTSRQRDLSGSLSDKCSRVFMGPEFLKRILSRSKTQRLCAWAA